jgi:hypothetical protein
MEINIPDRLDEVPEDLIQKVIDALPAYARLDEPGAKLEVTRAGDDGDHVRVYTGTAQYQRADRN